MQDDKCYWKVKIIGGTLTNLEEKINYFIQDFKIIDIKPLHHIAGVMIIYEECTHEEGIAQIF